ncbi:hypothetical protein TanjilG_02239 [Lupinus angustifolius]|uniref:Uncharacterized protein n=1 Tax=Lupinus angustifolius TaxID=3871 RepID=A0A4P1QQE9_LUPAN|nr:hypothetical protein TanjilG_02239 [Lupinus angustifolius]
MHQVNARDQRLLKEPDYFDVKAVIVKGMVNGDGKRQINKLQGCPYGFDCQNYHCHIGLQRHKAKSKFTRKKELPFWWIL